MSNDDKNKIMLANALAEKYRLDMRTLLASCRLRGDKIAKYERDITLLPYADSYESKQ